MAAPSEPATSVVQPERGRSLRTIIPLLDWLPRYEAAWLSADVVAGVTLAAYAVPVSLAYASLAGLPPHFGIYCYVAGGAAYAVFGTSRQLAIGPTSALSMLVGASLAGMANGDAARFASIAALTALVVAVLAGMAWALRLSGLVNFISGTILTGFKTGAALTIAMTQLPKLLGVAGGGNDFFERAATIARQLSETNVFVLSLGLAALMLLAAADWRFPGRPAALFVVAASIVLTIAADLPARGVTVVGPIPEGLPPLSWPALRLRDVDGVLPLAAACLLLAYVEGVSASRALAAKHGYPVDPRQELLALGAANLAASVYHGFPVAGGLSQSAVNDKAGARTPLALAVASASIAACLLFFSGVLYHLPNVVLAAIVLVAVRGLIDMEAWRRLWRTSRFEFAVACVALVAVLLLGILKGVLVAVLISLILLLAAVARPHVAWLGRIPGTRRFSDLDRHPENEQIRGLLAFRVDASLLYFNVEHVHGCVTRRLATADGVRLVVCDMSASPYIDIAAAEMLSELAAGLNSRGIAFRVVDAHARARDLLRAAGLQERLGPIGRSTSLLEVVAEHERSLQDVPCVPLDQSVEVSELRPAESCAASPTTPSLAKGLP